MIAISMRADYSEHGDIVPLIYSSNGKDIRVDRILSKLETSSEKIFICRCGNAVEKFILKSDQWYLCLKRSMN